jgi:hypothetical protein
MFIRQLFQSLLDMPGRFADIAMHDPLGAVLLTVGAILTTLSVAYFGLLVLGSVLDLFTPEASGPPRRPGQ